ncbi:hypothetical protein D9M71_531800 [compost metagenome]
MPFFSFLASLSALSLSRVASACSIRLSTSPMPRMREAIRSGWNGSSASLFSPIPMNLIGLPVMARTDSAAPPRASPSTLVSTTPVSGSASLKALAVLAASWPVMASTTNNVSIGLTAACRSLISAIISVSMCRRPAVSTMTTSMNLSLASRIAASAMATGFWLMSDGKNVTPMSLARVSSCLIAAGR